MGRDSVSARRRAFLGFLAKSPALAWAGFAASIQSTRKYAGRGDGLISSPEEALNVFDFESHQIDEK